MLRQLLPLFISDEGAALVQKWTKYLAMGIA